MAVQSSTTPQLLKYSSTVFPESVQTILGAVRDQNPSLWGWPIMILGALLEQEFIVLSRDRVASPPTGQQSLELIVGLRSQVIQLVIQNCYASTSSPLSVKRLNHILQHILLPQGHVTRKHFAANNGPVLTYWESNYWTQLPRPLAVALTVADVPWSPHQPPSHLNREMDIVEILVDLGNIHDCTKPLCALFQMPQYAHVNVRFFAPTTTNVIGATPQSLNDIIANSTHQLTEVKRNTIDDFYEPNAAGNCYQWFHSTKPPESNANDSYRCELTRHVGSASPWITANLLRLTNPCSAAPYARAIHYIVASKSNVAEGCYGPLSMLTLTRQKCLHSTHCQPHKLSTVRNWEELHALLKG